ncbi:short chain dehydrogenase [gamma proteobacterium HTCC5015]|nr:short chain dehydrogenase [gamma proteobacterium HTCC5015]
MQEMKVLNRGVELYAQVDGPEDAPTLLFLHGFPDDHRTWHRQVEGLKHRYQVITFDMRGVGRSSTPTDRGAFQIEPILSDIEAVINAVVGKEGKVHLVGHDWGSVIGWSFVAEAYYASRVLSYSSMSGPHLGLMLDWGRRNALSGNLTRMAKGAKQFLFSWYVYFFNVPYVPEFLIRRVGKRLWQTVLMQNGVDRHDPYIQEVDQAQVESIMLKPLELYRQNPIRPPSIPMKGSIDVPVQLIIAAQDRFISEDLFEFYDEYVNHLVRHPIDAKHWAHHSHADQFNRWVSQHVDGVEQDKGKRVA